MQLLRLPVIRYVRMGGFEPSRYGSLAARPLSSSFWKDVLATF